MARIDSQTLAQLFSLAAPVGAGVGPQAILQLLQDRGRDRPGGPNIAPPVSEPGDPQPPTNVPRPAPPANLGMPPAAGGPNILPPVVPTPSGAPAPGGGESAFTGPLRGGGGPGGFQALLQQFLPQLVQLSQGGGRNVRSSIPASAPAFSPVSRRLLAQQPTRGFGLGLFQ